jgi:hypothetical protein
VINRIAGNPGVRSSQHRTSVHWQWLALSFPTDNIPTLSDIPAQKFYFIKPVLLLLAVFALMIALILATHPNLTANNDNNPLAELLGICLVLSGLAALFYTGIPFTSSGQTFITNDILSLGRGNMA